MSDYRIATGHDVALVSLTVLTPQPEGRPMRATQRTYGLSRDVYDIAPYCEWIFRSIPNQAAYGALLTTLGLATLSNAAVTIYTRNQRLVYQRFNAEVVLPQMGTDGDWSNVFLRGITFRFTELEVPA